MVDQLDTVDGNKDCSKSHFRRMPLSTVSRTFAFQWIHSWSGLTTSFKSICLDSTSTSAIGQTSPRFMPSHAIWFTTQCLRIKWCYKLTSRLKSDQSTSAIGQTSHRFMPMHAIRSTTNCLRIKLCHNLLQDCDLIKALLLLDRPAIASCLCTQSEPQQIASALNCAITCSKIEIWTKHFCYWTDKPSLHAFACNLIHNTMPPLAPRLKSEQRTSAIGQTNQRFMPLHAIWFTTICLRIKLCYKSVELCASHNAFASTGQQHV